MINKMNKKAQTGRILTAFPVLIIIVLIMAVFIMLSIGIAKFKGPDEMRASSVVDAGSLPLENVNVKVGTEYKKMWVLDSMLYYLDNPQSITYSYPVSLLKDPLFSDSSRQPFITSDLMPTHYQKANVNSVGIPNNLVIACYYDSKNSPNCYPNAVQVRTCEDKGVTNMIRFNYKDKGYFYNSYFGRVLNYDGGQPSC